MNNNQPFCASLTGADDDVEISALQGLSRRFPFVEWALLYFPEKEGEARNPSTAWRNKFLDTFGSKGTALHLCGTKVFKDILAGKVQEEFSRYGRIQVNINARREDFGQEEVIAIYTALLAAGGHLILQHHDATAGVIDRVLQAASGKPYQAKLDVLFDTSRGKGISPDTWPSGLEVPESTRCGYAGGLGPDNIVSNLEKIQFVRKAAWGPNVNMAGDFWLDMESGLRTDNKFDLLKAESVLQQLQAKGA